MKVKYQHIVCYRDDVERFLSSNIPKTLIKPSTKMEELGCFIPAEKAYCFCPGGIIKNKFVSVVIKGGRIKNMMIAVGFLFHLVYNELFGDVVRVNVKKTLRLKKSDGIACIAENSTTAESFKAEIFQQEIGAKVNDVPLVTQNVTEKQHEVFVPEQDGSAGDANFAAPVFEPPSYF